MAQRATMFRRQALESLSAPEEFDERARILGPGAWVWVVGLCTLLLGFGAWAALGTVTISVHGDGLYTSAGGLTEVTSPVSGFLADDLPPSGTRAATDDVLGTVHAYAGGSADVRAPVDGTMVLAVHAVGDAVDPGTVVALMAPADRDLVFETFVALSDARDVEVGEAAVVFPVGLDSDTYGGIRGRVVAVDPWPATSNRIQSLLESDSLAEEVRDEGPVVSVQIAPITAGTPSGMAWTISDGPPEPLPIGTPVDVLIERTTDSLLQLGSSR